MSTVVIRNVTVDFPFEPYSVQKDYMEKIIESLDTRQNACLESPTGMINDNKLNNKRWWNIPQKFEIYY